MLQSLQAIVSRSRYLWQNDRLFPSVNPFNARAAVGAHTGVNFDDLSTLTKQDITALVVEIVADVDTTVKSSRAQSSMSTSKCCYW